MDYEEKYKIAFKRFKAWREKYLTKETAFGDVIYDKTGEMQAEFNAIFPELAESEEERTREEIISALKFANDGGVYDKHIAYLEKQKENPKSVDSIPSDCVSDVKCENRWLKVGDFLPDNGRDVLAKDALGNYLIANYDGDRWYISGYDNEDKPIVYTPAIKEWCDIPSEKQKEQTLDLPAGFYFIDKNGKKYYTDTLKCGNLKFIVNQKEQKPSWSEEDEKNLEQVIDVVYDYCPDPVAKYKLKDWLTQRLKSLRPQPKPEWSEEDEKMVKEALYCVGYTFGNTHPLVAWLKSLRPSWKPSEEQMEALEYVIRDYREDSCNATANYLQEILDHLKNM